MNTKQVIVFRKDLLKGDHSLRKGKIAAQVAHASLGSLLTLFDKTISYHYERDDSSKCNIDEDQPIYKYSTSFLGRCLIDRLAADNARPYSSCCSLIIAIQEYA